MKERLEQGLNALGLCPPTGAVEQLVRYAQLLLEQNRVMNLTAITEPDQVVDLHFLDCAGVALCAQLAGKTLVDVGTGAGFPGMVLKILVPQLELTLVDSLGKRLDWLSTVCAELGLTGVTIRHARGEELSLDPQFREQFDFATARAVAELRVLCELCLPYVKPGGRFLAMKALDCEEEVAQAGIQALADFIAACGLPTKLSQLRSKAEITPELLRQVADSTNLLPNGYQQLTHDEVYDIFLACL